MKKLLCIISATALLLGACNPHISQKKAVREVFISFLKAAKVEDWSSIKQYLANQIKVVDREIKVVNKDDFINIMKSSPSRGFRFTKNDLKILYILPNKARLLFSAQGTKQTPKGLLQQTLIMEFSFAKEGKKWVITKSFTKKREISLLKSSS